jgi:hypothetical protein
MTAVIAPARRDIANAVHAQGIPAERPWPRVVTRAVVDGISTTGNYIDIAMDLDVIFVISNCPQVNNPCNGFNPTPIRVVIWDQDRV